MTGAPFGRTETAVIVVFSDKSEAMDVGAKAAQPFFTFLRPQVSVINEANRSGYHEYSMAEDVIATRAPSAAHKYEQGDPNIRVGIGLRPVRV
jgi:hypothetical protein